MHRQERSAAERLEGGERVLGLEVDRALRCATKEEHLRASALNLLDAARSAAAERQAELVDAVARALRRAGLTAVYEPAGLTAKRLASTLRATARAQSLPHPRVLQRSDDGGGARAVRALEGAAAMNLVLLGATAAVGLRHAPAHICNFVSRRAPTA